VTGQGAHHALLGLLRRAVIDGGLFSGMICTDRGLIISSFGEEPLAERVAGVTALFDHIVGRARDDLAMDGVDEVALQDSRRTRLVVRPIAAFSEVRFFLVARVPPGQSWRRTTNALCQQLMTPLAALGLPELP
jgi:hypothetical protein